MPPIKCILNIKLKKTSSHRNGEGKDEQRPTLLTCQRTVCPSWHLKASTCTRGVVGRGRGGGSGKVMKLRVDKYWLDIHINTQVYHLQVVQERREQP